MANMGGLLAVIPDVVSSLTVSLQRKMRRCLNMLLAYGKALKSPHHRRRPFDKLRDRLGFRDSPSRGA